MGEKERLINRIPQDIIPHVYLGDEEKIYSFLSDQGLFKPFQMQYYLDNTANTYNVLLIGPISEGSRLINVLFNRNIVESETSLASVTKEIYFIKAKKPDNEILLKFDEIILADTTAFDTSCEANNDIKKSMIKNFKQLDIVLIIISKEHPLKYVEQNIKQILEWLNYIKFSERFIFVITKSRGLKTERQIFKRRLKERFNLSEQINDDNILFTDFPDTDDFTEKRGYQK